MYRVHEACAYTLYRTPDPDSPIRVDIMSNTVIIKTGYSIKVLL